MSVLFYIMGYNPLKYKQSQHSTALYNYYTTILHLHPNLAFYLPD
jgi:hypothetical protein